MMKRIAVLTSGGDSPGMNAAIRAVVRTALYNGMETVGVMRGFEGLMDGEFTTLDRAAVGGIIHRGGTILRTARSERFKTEAGHRAALVQLENRKVDALVVIGGDGSFRGAADLGDLGLPVIGIPATIDNDVAGTDVAIGFDTAVNTALSAVQKLRDTASSHDRLFIVEVMGRHAGFLALEVAVSTGAEYVVVPELKLDIGKLCESLHYSRKRGKTHSLIILAEGVMSGADLRSELQDTGGYDARVTVLGYIQRGGSPTSFDTVLASRMGAFAVESLLEGKSAAMVCSLGGQVELCSFSEGREAKKRLSPELLSLVEKLGV